LRAVRECTERLGELDALIRVHAQSKRFKPFVDVFCLLRGIDVQTAFLLAAEFGNFSRFTGGRAVSKWLGSVPKEYSSDEHTTHGHITKAGNKHARCALTEGAATFARHEASTPKTPRAGCEVHADVAALCAKANRRLKARFDHLVKDSKLNVNVAKMAVINEMIRWVWVVGCEVERREAMGV
jgi:transposase